jgi:hypothetical protein
MTLLSRTSIGVTIAAVGVVLAGAAAGRVVGVSQTRAPSGTQVLVSSSADRTHAAPLRGRSLRGAAYVFVSGSGISRVAFYIDDGDRKKAPRRVAHVAPWDLVGRTTSGDAKPLSAASLANGRHELTAVISSASGSRTILTVPFTVEHLFVSSGGSDSGRCDAAHPCKTLQRAYNVAQPGEGVDVLSGSYPDQEISGNNRGPSVVFAPSPGANVQLGWLYIHADNVELRDFTAGGWVAYWDSDGFTARNLTIHHFEIYGASNLRVLGGSVGPSYTPGESTPPNYISWGNGTVEPKNILIDGVRFHDFRRGFAADHMECMMVSGGDGITIRDSWFTRCDIFDIYFTQWSGPGPPHDITLENNIFDVSTSDSQPGDTSLAVWFGDHMDSFKNITVRYNTALQEIGIGENPKQNVSFVGNLAPLPARSCDSAIHYSHNVWFLSWTQPAKCVSSDVAVHTADPGFVDEAHLDLRLKRGSIAIGRGDPRNHPARDIFGHRRPRRGAPDAGAIESR